MTNDDIDLRKKICESCEHLVGDVTPTCNLCACPISYMIMINSNKCPVDKWQLVQSIKG